MWRRPQNNPALPVPTFYPDDGADSHLHSPRRRPLAGQDMPTISTALNAPNGANATLDAVHPGHLKLQNASTSSASSFLDPFNEAAYQEWINSLGLGQQQSHVDTNTIWPNSIARGSNKSATDPSMCIMPSYLSSTLRDATTADPMHLSGPSLDEDTQMETLKVPTNTPTAFLGADHSGSGPLSHGRAVHSPFKLANGITRSIHLQYPKPIYLQRLCELAHPLSPKPTTPPSRFAAVRPTTPDSTTSKRGQVSKRKSPPQHYRFSWDLFHQPFSLGRGTNSKVLHHERCLRYHWS